MSDHELTDDEDFACNTALEVAGLLLMRLARCPDGVSARDHAIKMFEYMKDGIEQSLRKLRVPGAEEAFNDALEKAVATRKAARHLAHLPDLAVVRNDGEDGSA